MKTEADIEGALPEPIKAYIHAYNASDVSAMEECLSEDVTFKNITDGEVDASTAGKSEFIDLARKTSAFFSKRKQTVLNSISVSDTTLIEIRFTATVAQDMPNGWTAGQNIELTGRSLFRTKQNKITELIDES